jgi:hypothetical protein
MYVCILSNRIPTPGYRGKGGARRGMPGEMPPSSGSKKIGSLWNNPRRVENMQKYYILCSIVLWCDSNKGIECESTKI